MQWFSALSAAILVLNSPFAFARPRAIIDEAPAATCHGFAPTMIGTAGDDRLVGTPTRDVIAALNGDDHILGLDGDDELCGGHGADTIRGHSGADHLSGETAPDVMSGGAGDDRLFGGGEADRLRGGDDHDFIRGGDRRDVLQGGPGDDDLKTVYPDDPMRGGEGDDLLQGFAVDYGAAQTGMVVDIGAGTAVGQGEDRLSSVQRVKGSPFDDHLRGADGYQDFYGRSGDDLLEGLGDFDDLTGGPGDDRVLAGSGDDVIRGERQFDDDVVVGNDTYDGGDGIDLFDFGFTELPVWADLSRQRAFSEGVDVLIHIEDVSGSVYAFNRLIGDDLPNRFEGGEDGDEIDGRGGDDEISGGFYATDDKLVGGSGNDSFFPKLCVGGNVTFDGGPGIDTLDFSTQQCGPGSVTVDLAEGSVQMDGDEGTVTAVENVIGSEGHDRLMGDDQANVLDGGHRGADVLHGREGDDQLVGGPGSDQGDGGPGRDICIDIEQHVACEDSQKQTA